MKVAKLLAFVAVVFSLALCASACTEINRRNTIWVGLPSPMSNGYNDITVRVYRTDKYNYNIDAVDARVNVQTKALSKVKFKSRLVPSGDNTTAYSLMDTTSYYNDTRTSWALVKKLRTGVFEIIMRAFFDDFPVPVDVKNDKLFWYSVYDTNLYYAKANGSMVVVHNVLGQRDFNSLTSSWVMLDIAPLFREQRIENSTGSNIIGALRPRVWDSASTVAFAYGTKNTANCNDGWTLFRYNSSAMTLLGDVPPNTQFYYDPTRDHVVYTGPKNELTIRRIGEFPELVMHTQYTDAQLKKIISRASLGAWLGPLIVLICVWGLITVFCVVFNQSRC